MFTYPVGLAESISIGVFGKFLSFWIDNLMVCLLRTVQPLIQQEKNKAKSKHPPNIHLTALTKPYIDPKHETNNETN